MKVKDIIKDDKFNEFLGYEIEAYNNRPAPQEGCRYRRTPYDALKDAGIFTVEGIRETFIKVANLESGLPKSQRDAITGLVFFTVVPLQLVCLWLSKGLAILSDLLRELCYRAWFKQTTK